MPERVEEWARQLRKGAIQLCILALLREGSKYGFQIMGELRSRSDGYFDIPEGTLYPALHRMEKRGYLESSWVTGDTGNPRRYYRLTVEGEEAYDRARDEWSLFVEGCTGVMGEDHAGS